MKKKQPRSYSLAQKTAALAAVLRHNGNIYAAAKELSIPEGTLRGWILKAKAGGTLSDGTFPAPDDETALDDQLERLARQMVAVMPGKVEEANLQELARTLAIVLNTMNQARAGKEQTSHAREKLAEILERYAVGGSAAGTPETVDGL